MLKIPGCPAASGSSIFQNVSLHAFQAFLPQAFAQWEMCHINWAAERAQTDDSPLAAFHIQYFSFLPQVSHYGLWWMCKQFVMQPMYLQFCDFETELLW